MARRVLVTGGGGFVGQWTARALLDHGDEVWASGKGPRPASPAILDATQWKAIRWLSADITQDDAVRRLLTESRPDLIIHLAGVSFVPDAEVAPVAAWDVNVLGAVRVLSNAAALRAHGVADPVALVVGSGVQYGAHQVDEMPLLETAAQMPLSAYGASKAAQEIAALQISRTSGLRVICTRSFSHSGVGHASVFLIPSLVDRVRSMRRNSGPLEIGNDAIRDYLHVTDAVSAYLALAERGRPGEVYNVASGVGIGVRQLALLTVNRAGLETEIVSKPHLQRQTDVPVLVGSNAKIRQDTGWQPSRPVSDIIDDLLAAG